jgi:hypothetical protein
MIDMVVTDFGNVLLSNKTIAWLDSINAEWRSIVSSKKRRGKKAAYVRAVFRNLEDAIKICAEIEFHSGSDLERF